MECCYCKTEFVPKRRTATFCSTKCRVYFNRGYKVVPKVDKSVSEEPIPERDINRVTGEVYEDKASKLDSLREMMESVNQKYEAPLESKASEIPWQEVADTPTPMQYEPVSQPYTPRPFIPKPGVTLPAKREVYFDEGDKVELVYEDNPL